MGAPDHHWIWGGRDSWGQQTGPDCSTFQELGGNGLEVILQLRDWQVGNGEVLCRTETDPDLERFEQLLLMCYECDTDLLQH